MKNTMNVEVMNREEMTFELDDAAIDAVSGALAPFAIGFGLAAVFGGGATFGYTVGKDRAIRDNRND